MTTETPPEDWVLLEAAKRSGWDAYTTQVLREAYGDGGTYRALCDMIAKHEKPPVDRKVLCAREALNQCFDARERRVERIALRAIELWEEGFGK
jgi:hypothetical protein